MIELHPEILIKQGKKKFAILPYEEFEELVTLLEELEDLKLLRAAKQQEAHLPTTSLEEVKQLFKVV
ncbi:MAG: hypothetical protein RIT27_1658 [Pseudomonadota bacterium]|jgi:hypothetical protein